MDKASILKTLPGLDCGLCGEKTCADFAEIVSARPQEIRKCVHLKGAESRAVQPMCRACAGGQGRREQWRDSLDREFDFVLDTFANEPGPRETILPYNPMLVRELDVQKGDILIGRPMGMSCGCPITHCGVAMNVDQRNGVIVWCVTGPLGPRTQSYKDVGYYVAEAYEGLVREARSELKIGMRYWFMPHRCMLQWRHSGLVNFLNRGREGLQVRVEGLLIG